MIRSYSTKGEMLQFAKGLRCDELRELAEVINCDPLNFIEVQTKGPKEVVLRSLTRISKSVLFAAIDDLFEFDEFVSDDQDEIEVEEGDVDDDEETHYTFSG